MSLLVLATIVSFLQPYTLILALHRFQLYQTLIIGSFLLCLPMGWERIWKHATNPITLCVILIPLVAGFSNLIHGRPDDAVVSFRTFAAVVLFFVVFVELVQDGDRLRFFLYLFVGLTALLAIFGTLLYYGIIRIPGVEVYREFEVSREPDKSIRIHRLHWLGVFSDPDVLCSLLAPAIVFVLGFTDRAKTWLRRLPLLILIVFFTYAMLLTRSRGGFLAVVCGVGVFLWARYGFAKSILVAACGVVTLSLAQPDLASTFQSFSSGAGAPTGMIRLQLWRSGLDLFWSNPLIGIGHGMYGRNLGMAAHNPFIQCFVELGICGGTAFLGAFLFGFVGLLSLMRQRENTELAQLSSMAPMLLGGFLSYVVATSALCRVEHLETFFMLGLGAVCYDSQLGKNVSRVNRSSILFLMTVSLIFLFISTALLHWTVPSV